MEELPARRLNDKHILDVLTNLSAEIASIKDLSKRNEQMNIKNESQNKETHNMLSAHIKEETDHAVEAREEQRKMHDEQREEHRILMGFFDDMSAKVHLKQHEFINTTMDNVQYLSKIKRETLAKWLDRGVVALISLVAAWTFSGLNADIEDKIKKVQEKTVIEQKNQIGVK